MDRFVAYKTSSMFCLFPRGHSRARSFARCLSHRTSSMFCSFPHGGWANGPRKNHNSQDFFDILFVSTCIGLGAWKPLSPLTRLLRYFVYFHLESCQQLELLLSYSQDFFDVMFVSTANWGSTTHNSSTSQNFFNVLFVSTRLDRTSTSSSGQTHRTSSMFCSFPFVRSRDCRGDARFHKTSSIFCSFPRQ